MNLRLYDIVCVTKYMIKMLECTLVVVMNHQVIVMAVIRKEGRKEGNKQTIKWLSKLTVRGKIILCFVLTCG